MFFVFDMLNAHISAEVLKMNQKTEYINQNIPVVPCMYHFSSVEEQLIACARCERGFGYCPMHDMPYDDQVMC